MSERNPAVSGCHLWQQMSTSPDPAQPKVTDDQMKKLILWHLAKNSAGKQFD